MLPDELFTQAAALGLPALGIVDHNSLAGIVLTHRHVKETGVRLIVGCRPDLADGSSMLVYPTNRAAYRCLCRVLTLGKGRVGPGACDLSWRDLVVHADGLLAILVPKAAGKDLADRLHCSVDFRDQAYLALMLRRWPGMPEICHAFYDRRRRSLMLDLDRFFADCEAAVARGTSHKGVYEIVARAVSDPDAVITALGEPRRAAPNLLYRSLSLTVVNLVGHRAWQSCPTTIACGP